MCSIDYEPCQAWSETPRTARKAHRCSSCCQTIAAGEAYLNLGYVFDGSGGTEKVCFPCWWVWEIFGSAHGQKPMPSNLDEAIQECIGDGDDDWRGELAFLKRRFRTSPVGRERLRELWARRRPEVSP